MFSVQFILWQWRNVQFPANAECLILYLIMLTNGILYIAIREANKQAGWFGNTLMNILAFQKQQSKTFFLFCFFKFHCFKAEQGALWIVWALKHKGTRIKYLSSLYICLSKNILREANWTSKKPFSCWRKCQGGKPTSLHSSVQGVYSVCIHAFHQMKAWLRFVDIRNNAHRVPRFPYASLPPKCFTILLSSRFPSLPVKAACRKPWKFPIQDEHCCTGVSLENASR